MLKKKKKYILKTQGNLTKAQLRGRERSPWKELTNEKAAAGLGGGGEDKLSTGQHTWFPRPVSKI